jgi:Acyl-CoA dehydrogenase, C-terminal domain
VRAALARAASVLLAAEAVTVMGSRAVHCLTGEMSVVSAVIKALVPTLIDRMIDELSELLGARSFLDGVYANGAFQKIQRDHRIVAIFDGSTVVNRASLIGQFPRLAGAYRRGIQPDSQVAEAATITAAPPPFDARELRLASRTGCGVTQSLPGLAAQAERANGELAAVARGVAAAAAQVHDRLALARPAARPDAGSYELAALYELCFAAAACLLLWQGGERAALPAASPLWEDALWTRACLTELGSRLAQRDRGLASGVAGNDTVTDRILDWLTAAVGAGDPLSLWSAVPS